MTKAKIAVLTQRASDTPRFMVMVDDNIINSTTDYTFSNGLCLISPRIF